jgi:hypothetical protein
MGVVRLLDAGCIDNKELWSVLEPSDTIKRIAGFMNSPEE